MGTPRFTPEFKEESVRQITERGYSVAEVSERLGVSAHSLPDATATSVASAQRPSKRPHREDRNCLPERGHSKLVSFWSNLS